MRALPSPLRKKLEMAVVAARRAAESAARASIGDLGVFADRRPEHLDADQAALRNGLRAKWRQLGGDRGLLIAECAYEQWHRLLFARFLAENDLLRHPKYKAAVTLADCEELAAELGEPDGWSVAARFASEILPGIFRLDDPCVRLRLAPEGRHALEQILDGLPADVFTADDSLGWVYQFWQKDKKDEVNASERKIGGADLGPVTQLFTENYMVRFLLENSLGAWWATRHPNSALVKGFDYLRFDNDGQPAAGSFDGWPARVAEVTVMDPCCGSGHFLVEAFTMLWQMRAEEEGLSQVEAQDAVLRNNLFGLELDPRCVQIAMFAVALKAWKAAGGWRPLPVPSIACSGIPVKGSVQDWKTLAGGDDRLENALVRLHILFRDADTLGSLIDPKRAAEITDPTGLQASLEDVDWKKLEPILRLAVASETDDLVSRVLGIDVASSVRAADLLSRSYTLVVTNVPFLGITKFAAALRSFIFKIFHESRHDVGYAMVSRWFRNGSVHIAVVCPSDWLAAPSTELLRRVWISSRCVQLVARLGYSAFQGGIRANPCLLIAGSRPRRNGELRLIEASGGTTPSSTERLLQGGDIATLHVATVLERPGAPVVGGPSGGMRSLGDFVQAKHGLSAGDSPQFERSFWELVLPNADWEYLHSSAADTKPYGGRHAVVLWEGEQGKMAALANSVRHLNHKAQQWRSGRPVWGRTGVAINKVGQLRASLYTGERFSERVVALVPGDPDLVPAIWHFAQSGELEAAVRTLVQTLVVAPSSIAQVPFDIERWRKVAEDAGPLPQPWSDDPTQWLFAGRPEVSTSPLQVAVAQLMGFRWPEHDESDDLVTLADADGIVCLPSVAGEAPAAARVQQVLAAAFGHAWSPGKVKELLEQAGGKKNKNLADWLRDEFFKHHCAVFGNRPFVWHIWDGQRDGFAALVNYHRLDRTTLQKLTYTYLGVDWMERQRADVRDGVAGAESRLSAALKLQRKLEAILEGEKPYDIYVRWKDPHEQPMGWEPDLNDGVRLNIRPFVEAGVLRAPFSIHWHKDRGKNPDGSERHNDIHLSLAEKLDARKRAGRA